MSARLYVGRVSRYASASDIEWFFRGYGRISDIVLKNGYAFVEFDDPRDAEDAVYELSGKELCGERVNIEFTRPTWRTRIGRYDRYLSSRRSFKYGPPIQTPHRMLVENLSSGCAWQIVTLSRVVQSVKPTYVIARSGFWRQALRVLGLVLARKGEGGITNVGASPQGELKDLMRSAGEVTFADAHKVRVREGVVCFATHEGLERALEKMQGREINGRKLKLTDISEKRYARSRSPARSRSSTRRRSRSVLSLSSRNHTPSYCKEDESGSDSETRSGSESETRHHEHNATSADIHTDDEHTKHHASDGSIC
uniref:RRM domain-containing protein n=2 Tax=Ascaris TaxID=6251 RepID=A0A9J2P8W9_ASCLU